MNALTRLTKAEKLLAEATVEQLPEVSSLVDYAEAARVYAQRGKLGTRSINHATKIKLLAERKVAELVDAGQAAGQIATKGGDQAAMSGVRTLDDVGVDRRRLAEYRATRDAFSPDEIEAAIDAANEADKEARRSHFVEAAKRKLKKDSLADRVAALPAGTYRVIYADPPWSYGDARTTLAGYEGSAAAAQYPTMKTSAICELDVKAMAAPDAVLFLWATFPLLPDALEVVKAWGFKYKTAFVWDKERANLGNYHDARAELLIIATRGSCTSEISERPRQIQSVPRGKHSAKPEHWRELIEKMYPSAFEGNEVRAVELFRRGAAPGGWVAWGNEAA